MHVGTRVVSPTGKKGCAVGRKDKNVTGTSQEKRLYINILLIITYWKMFCKLLIDGFEQGYFGVKIKFIFNVNWFSTCTNS